MNQTAHSLRVDDDRVSAGPGTATPISLPSIPLFGGQGAGRVAALIALACAIIHIPVLTMHWADHKLITVIMIGLLVGCLPCALHLWRGPTMGDWCIAVISSIAMAFTHMTTLSRTIGSALPTNGGGMSMSVGQHSRDHIPNLGTAVTMPAHDAVMTAPMVLACVQMVVGSAVLVITWWRTPNLFSNK